MAVPKWKVERVYINNGPDRFCLYPAKREWGQSAVADFGTDAGAATLAGAAPDLLAALRRAAPWLGKLIADGGHLRAVAPNDAIGALQQAEAAIRKATGADAGNGEG